MKMVVWVALLKRGPLGLSTVALKLRFISFIAHELKLVGSREMWQLADGLSVLIYELMEWWRVLVRGGTSFTAILPNNSDRLP